MVVPPPTDIELDLSQPLGIVWYPSLVVKSVKPGSQAARLGIGPGWEVLGLAGEELRDVQELEKKLEALKAEGCLGQSMMFQPAAVPATEVKTPSTAADAAAMLRERAAAVAREEEEARLNMREVPLELDLSQPLGILFNKTLEAESVTEGSQAARLGVEAGWRAVSLAGEAFTNTRDLVARIQAMKADGATTVAAVFAAPQSPDNGAAMEVVAEGDGEKRPAPAEEFREITMDLSQPLGISFTDDVVAKEVKEGSQAEKLGVGRLWKLTTAAGAPVATAKELVAKIKGLKSEGAKEVILRFLVSGDSGATPAKKQRTE
ncbi:unnamed protein product [Symbiodinium microadriaticum]|nr:unnamed protein product [Symbiodinium microadriaticum]